MNRRCPRIPPGRPHRSSPDATTHAGFGNGRWPRTGRNTAAVLPHADDDPESGITWICPYFSLFCFALHRLFSSFTLVFDTSNYIVLNVARGCLGNIWATLIFWATLFGAKQENSKNYTKIEDLAIFQSKSFFFFRRIFR